MSVLSSINVATTFNSLEGMYELKMARMQLRRYTFDNLKSNYIYQGLKRDIDNLTAKVDACCVYLAENGCIEVDRVVGIKSSISRLAPFLSDAHKGIRWCQEVALGAMSPDAIKMHTKIVNYITAIEYYHKDLMVRTLIPEYTDVAIPYANAVEVYIGHLYVMRNALLMGAEPDADMAANVGMYIRNTTRVMQALPTHISLPATVALMRRIVSVYNAKSRAINAKSQKYTCCTAHHELQEAHRAELKTALYTTVDKQQPFTISEAKHHIERYMVNRSKIHTYCTKY